MNDNELAIWPEDIALLEDIQNTDLSEATMAFARLVSKLQQVAPKWRRIEITREDDGVARLVIFDGSEEELLQ